MLNTYEVDNYPGLPGINGFDMGMKFREHADKLECEFKTAVVLGITKGQSKEAGFTVKTDEGSFDTRAVVAATGAVHARLNIPGEEELTGKGVSYCATCDGAFFRRRTVAVIGGGDVAAEDAIFLARNCEKVYLIHRRDELRAARVLQDKLKSLPNVEIIWEGLLLKNVKTNETRKLAVQGVFVAVGVIPDSDLFQELTDRDEKGYIIAGEDGICSTDGIFAAGDVRKKKLRQIVTAVSDGANAINSVQEYLLKLKVTK